MLYLISQAAYHYSTGLFILPLSRQVTQEEVFICPSHAAVPVNYSDPKFTPAGICGDARCFCINPQVSSVSFIVLHRLLSLVSAGKKLVLVAQDEAAQAAALVCLYCIYATLYLDASSFHLQAPSFTNKPKQPQPVRDEGRKDLWECTISQGRPGSSPVDVKHNKSYQIIKRAGMGSVFKLLEFDPDSEA